MPDPTVEQMQARVESRLQEVGVPEQRARSLVRRISVASAVAAVMSRVPLGILLGLVIGVVDVLLMLPLSFLDRRAAFAGAFCARFGLVSTPRPYASRYHLSSQASSSGF
jgi:hypothetical protein